MLWYSDLTSFPLCMRINQIITLLGLRRLQALLDSTNKLGSRIEMQLNSVASAIESMAPADEARARESHAKLSRDFLCIRTNYEEILAKYGNGDVLNKEPVAREQRFANDDPQIQTSTLHRQHMMNCNDEHMQLVIQREVS